MCTPSAGACSERQKDCCVWVQDSCVAYFGRSRGGEGFAFVVHNDNAVSLGEASSGMGFVGIKNGIAVEFDTFYNPEQLDPWENHVAVVTRGWRDPLSTNHTYELGHATSCVSTLLQLLLCV